MIAIWNQAFVLSATGGRSDRYGTEEYSDLLAGTQLVVAERHRAILGTIALLDSGGQAPTIARPDEREVTLLAVATPVRGRGIAQILLAWAHGEALRAGARALVLSPLRGQLVAQGLCRSLGYRRVPDRDADDRDQTGLAYRLRLSQGRAALRSSA